MLYLTLMAKTSLPSDAIILAENGSDNVLLVDFLKTFLFCVNHIVFTFNQDQFLTLLKSAAAAQKVTEAQVLC